MYDKNTLTHILYSRDTAWTPTTLQIELKDLLRPQKTKHFSQAADTLNGTHNSKLLQCLHMTHPTDLSTLVQDTFTDILKHFQCKPGTKDVALNITATDIQYRINKWKEKTSTSPLKQHLGHYHAHISPPHAQKSTVFCQNSSAYMRQ